MITYTYNVGCRNCGQGDYNKHLSIDETVDYDDTTIYTEFDCMEAIEQLRRDSGSTCKFCGSDNVEIFDIEINSHPLSKFTDLVERCKMWREWMFQINIDKRANGLTLKTGGSDNIDREFFEAAIKELLAVIERRPHTVYKPLPIGNFFICITGGYDLVDDVNARIENLKTGGITKEEILTTIEPIVQRAGLGIKEQSSRKTADQPILKGGKFKGQSFNSWFYSDSLGAAEEEQIPFANVYFKIDENTLVAHGTGDGESPKDFIDKNRSEDFVIDQSIPPKIINGSTVYYAKKC